MQRKKKGNHSRISATLVAGETLQKLSVSFHFLLFECNVGFVSMKCVIGKEGNSLVLSYYFVVEQSLLHRDA